MTAKAAPRARRATGRGGSDWYKDAVIYQLHIKAFQDANDDGIGDFQGLIRRLDYVAELGVNTIWILPFYPSPLRDDGYDIADYLSVNPSYGAMRDFRRFVEEAHRRDIRVVTELVINHTSDQHPWFQRARKAKPGSPERDFYVWSDTDQKYPETRIIFIDTEKSNWTWDAEAGAYFWHRFYAHQPDLNFDNPRVLEEVLTVMHFWLDMGVDGLRLDAIPYLVERGGTNNENLPETHAVLKKIRAELDAHYPDRMLLAEANQWPEDTRPYFGDGDECHMGFHFPLMPRLYMAVAQEDRNPITDILRQTPDIPDGCQWAIFLRNHDELTLEMVTESERAYLWNSYAPDRRARINLGIRRRLAPLLGNDRRKIELLNRLLFSMPGTPVVYYGDEIGMGDNYFLNDRDGVRTPMQWSGDRNGGFSHANPQQLYLPSIQDPVYGYEVVNVEAQTKSAGSLLNWTKRTIAVRNRHKAFGRGAIDFLYPRNRKILAYTRAYGDELLLCVFNLSQSAEAVELDLSKFRDRVPVELEGGEAFPPVSDRPYMLTLPPYGAYWFQLAPAAALPEWRRPPAEVPPDFVTLLAAGTGVVDVVTTKALKRLGREILPGFLPLQRWFGGKGEPIETTTVSGGPTIGKDYRLAIADIDLADSGAQCYFLPLAALWGEEHVQVGAPTLPATLAKLRRTNHLGALIDTAAEPRFAEALVAAMRAGSEVSEGDLRLRAEGTEALADLGKLAARPLAVDQSNVSLALGDKALLKIYRRLRSGPQPDVEIARFLTGNTTFRNTPALLGEATLAKAGAKPATVAGCFSFVHNQGDGWTVVVAALSRALTNPATAAARRAFPLDLADVLGKRTAELHNALATPVKDRAFGTEPVTRRDIAAAKADAQAQAKNAVRRLAAGEKTADIEEFLRRSAEIDRLIARLGKIAPHGIKSRIHGDYHLGQVLIAKSDVYLIDFEGEPRRSLAERRARHSPLRDVAGMLRSFDYAAFAAIDRARTRGAVSPKTEAIAWAWRDRSAARFLAAYAAAIEGADKPTADDDLLKLFILQKALYEIGYEAANRPAWVATPVRGVLALLDREKT